MQGSMSQKQVMKEVSAAQILLENISDVIMISSHKFKKMRSSYLG